MRGYPDFEYFMLGTDFLKLGHNMRKMLIVIRVTPDFCISRNLQ